MISVRKIGSYLGRPVRLASLSSAAALLDREELSNAAVALLWVNNGGSAEERKTLVASLFDAGPVAIAFWGNQAGDVLDAALDLQSARVGDPHVMTCLLSSSTAEEAMWEFLHLVFPSPERLSEWKDYVIVCLCDNGKVVERLEASCQEGYLEMSDQSARAPSA
jgi:hypothetical protein